MTRTIQPPLLAWAWAWAVGDPAGEPRIAAHHARLREHRALEDDGLLWLIQPDESGMDASPKSSITSGDGWPRGCRCSPC